MRAVFDFGDFVMARDIHMREGACGHPPSTWRMAISEKLHMNQHVGSNSSIKYLEFDLVDVGREVAFYEFSRVIG